MLKNLYRQFLRPAAGAQRNEQELAGIRDLLRSARPAAGQAALASFLERNPHDPAALHLKGVAELDGGRHADALHWLLLAVEFDPDDAMFRANLGLAYWRLGQPHAARANLEASLAIRPDLASASLNLANVLLDLGEPGSARYRLDAALAHGDATAAAEQAALWTALAGLEAYIPDVDAVQCLNRAQALDPGSPIVPLLGYMPHAQRCDWRYPTADLIAFLERQAGTEDFDEGPVLAPAIADCLPVSRGARLATARRYGRMIVRRVAGLGIRRDAVAAARMGGRIRVGYLSADFHNHPTMQLLRGVLAAHDHQRFEWHAYSLGPDDGSGVRQEVQAGFTAFHDLRVDSPLDCAQRIAADGIDILVDLKGYTGAGWPEIMALRPAPVQVNYLGYPGSMAADFVDYLIADPVLIPEGGEAWYGEKIVRLPYCYQPNDTKRRSIAEFKAYLKEIPGSELVAIKVDGYHTAAVAPDECARATLEFIARRGAKKK